MRVLTNTIIKATASAAAAATLLGVGVTPAFADQTANPTQTSGQSQTAQTARERLQSAIDAADAKLNSGRSWDDDSRTAFDDALAAARSVADDASDEDVVKAAAALETATTNLKSDAEVRLDKAVKAGDTRTADTSRTWSQTSKTAYDKAYRRATQGGFADTAAGDSQREAAAEDLETATTGLESQAKADYRTAHENADTRLRVGGDDGGRYDSDYMEALRSILETADEKVKDATDDKAGDDVYATWAKNISDTLKAPEYRTSDDLTKALADAKTQSDRDLRYDGDQDSAAENEFVAARDAAKAALKKDETTQAKAAERLNEAIKNLSGHSTQERKFNDAVAKAEKLDSANYTPESYGRLESLLTDKDTFYRTANAGELSKRANDINNAIDDLVVASWTFNGVTLNKDAKGVWTIEGQVELGGKPDGLKAVGADGREVALTAGDETFQQGADTLGVGENVGVLTGKDGERASFSIGYHYTTGSETTVSRKDNDGVAFTRMGDGSWAASYDDKLGTKDDLADYGVKEITLSDGSKLERTGLSELEATPLKEASEKTSLTRTATFEGKDSHDTPVKVTVNLSAVYDPNVTLSLTRKDADGRSVKVDVPDGSGWADALPQDITLPAQDRSTLDSEWTADVTKGDSVGDVAYSMTSKADGTRVILVTVKYYQRDGDRYLPTLRRIRVEVPFQAAKKVVGNEKAALRGFTVNGKPLEGYSKDVVDYTIHAGENEQVTVVPVAEDGQDVRAGDSRQTAYTTTQWWTVSKDGETRTYSVTLVRDHSKLTAAESFKPSDPVERTTDTPNPSESNTDLKSVGYMLDGEYHGLSGDDLTIPEGGVFAYEKYAGQTVDVTSSRADGMTWTYSIGVLASDGTTYRVHDVKVTYVTAATHKAELEGIKVDGKAVDGFAKDVREYTVAVANPDRYVVTPVFDKTSGMGVTVHKDGATATLTAVSADGLERAVYTVRVKASPAAAALASTGVALRRVAPIAALLALLGIGLGLVGIRREM